MKALIRTTAFALALVLMAFPALAEKISTTRDSAFFWNNQWDIGTGIFVKDAAGVGAEIRVNYARHAFIPSWTPYVADMVTTLTLLPGDATIIVGAGFGPFEEVTVLNHAFTNIVSIEDSDWIQTAKGEAEDQEIAIAIAGIARNPNSADGLSARSVLADGGARTRVKLLNENLLTQGSRNAAKTELGGSIDVVFTDDLLDYITDAEAVTLCQAINNYANIRVIHAVGPAQPGNTARTNAQGIAAWRTLLDANNCAGDELIDWQSLVVQ